MASGSVTVKVFLRCESSTEVKKFILDDSSTITSYIYIKEKLMTIFPKLRNAPFKIMWKDSDGDEITIDSDDDLMMACTEMSGTVLVLYVTVTSRPQEFDFYATVHHPKRHTVICDACDKQISGYRYKCLQCADYDLCLECENAGNHSEHFMLRTSNGELPFIGACKKIAECINKSARRAQSMAYKEACRAGKFARKFDRRWHENNYKPSETEEPKNPQPGPSTCPMTNVIYDFANAAAQAAQAAMGAAAESGAAMDGAYAAASAGGNDQQQEKGKPAGEGQQQSQQSNPQPNQPTPHLVEMIVKALNNMFGENRKQQNNDNNDQDQPSTTQANNNQRPGSVTPMEEDAPRSNQPRRNSWTMLDEDISIENRTSEILQPSVPMAPTSQPMASTMQPMTPTTQPMTPNLQPMMPTAQPMAPTAPPLDPKIADGLKILKDMGFADDPYLIALLKRFDGNVGFVIKFMFENQR